jgi:hypothetical protein
VLDALARALQLDEAERAHLFSTSPAPANTHRPRRVVARSGQPGCARMRGCRSSTARATSRTENVPTPRFDNPPTPWSRRARLHLPAATCGPTASLPHSDTDRASGTSSSASSRTSARTLPGRSRRLVVAPFVWSDGTCDFCREGLQTSCRHGGSWARDGIDGGQGEAVRVRRPRARW